MPSLPRKDQTNVEKPPSVNKISSTSTAARKPFSSQPTVNNPPVVPDFLPGKVNAKLFPPRHFKFEQIEIGSWKVGFQDVYVYFYMKIMSTVHYVLHSM